MDFIGQIATNLGINPDTATALAGAAFGGVQKEVASSVGEQEAAELGAAVPESSGWMAKAQELVGDSSSAGGLGALVQGLGGSGGMDMASLTGIFSQLNLDGAKVMEFVPMLVGFLKERLPADLWDKVAAAVPMLSNLQAGGNAMGGLGDALGGLLK